MTDVRASGQWCSTPARDSDSTLCEQHYASTFTSTARQQRQRCLHNGEKCALDGKLYQCPLKDETNAVCADLKAQALGNNIPLGETRKIWCGEFNGPNANEALCRDIIMQANAGAGLFIPGIMDDPDIRFYSYETCKYAAKEGKCVLPTRPEEISSSLCKTAPTCVDVLDVVTSDLLTCGETIEALLDAQTFAIQAADIVAGRFPEQCGL